MFFLLLSLFDGYQLYYNTCASDVIAIANTYIVFTTLVLVIIAIIATLAGIWFTKQFSLSKEKEIRESAEDFFAEINSNSQFSDKFVKKLFANESILRKIEGSANIAIEQAEMKRLTAIQESNESGGIKDFSEGTKPSSEVAT